LLNPLQLKLAESGLNRESSVKPSQCLIGSIQEPLTTN